MSCDFGWGSKQSTAGWVLLPVCRWQQPGVTPTSVCLWCCRSLSVCLLRNKPSQSGQLQPVLQPGRAATAGAQ
jgi:hypothetical protein